MVIMVIYVPSMATQPSLIESWSLADLRCNVYEGERQRSRSVERDRPPFSTWEGAGWLTSEQVGLGARERIDWTRSVIGASVAAAGGLWLMAILKFDVPWISVLPLLLMLAGSFIIAASLNPASANGMTANDRCDH
jgi:hypothetical protein